MRKPNFAICVLVLSAIVLFVLGVAGIPWKRRSRTVCRRK
jgi:hypothetical protein